MPRSFVCNVLLLADHLRTFYNLDPEVIELLRSLESDIDAKLEALRKREAFSAFKSAPVGSNELENLCRVYLDLAFIHNHWRSNNEHPL